MPGKEYGPLTLAEIIPESAGALASDQETKHRLEVLRQYDFRFLTDNFIASKMRQFSPEQLFPLLPYFAQFNLTVDPEVSVRLGAEFKRFVAVALLRPSRRNAPSGPVDLFWHFFILHTPEYMAFCTAIFGIYGPQPRLGKHLFTHWEDKRAHAAAENAEAGEAMVDHIPATDETRPMMLKSYKETREIYVEIFGGADERFWPERGAQATCGDSFSGFVNPLYKRST